MNARILVTIFFDMDGAYFDLDDFQIIQIKKNIIQMTIQNSPVLDVFFFDFDDFPKSSKSKFF